jgi:hypothetical protein
MPFHHAAGGQLQVKILSVLVARMFAGRSCKSCHPARESTVAILLNAVPAAAAWRMLFVAFAISVVGNQLTNIAVFPKFGSIGGGPTWFVFAALAQALGTLLISPVTGVLSDRGFRVTLMLVGDIGRAITLLCLAFSATLPVAIAFAGVSSALGGFFFPTEGALEAQVRPGPGVTSEGPATLRSA